MINEAVIFRIVVAVVLFLFAYILFDMGKWWKKHNKTFEDGERSIYQVPYYVGSMATFILALWL